MIGIFFIEIQLAQSKFLKIENWKKTKREICILEKATFAMLPTKSEKSYLFFVYAENLFYFSGKKKSFKNLGDKFLTEILKGPEKFTKYKNGLSNESLTSMEKVYGENSIDFKMDSILTLFFREITSPFLLFQIFSLIVWFNDNYEEYAFLIVFIMGISIWVKINEIVFQQNL